MHRHLRIELLLARAELAALEAQAAPTPLIDEQAIAVGTRIADARRTIAAARRAFEVRARALLEVADERAAEMVADADAEAHVLRAAAAWLRPTASEQPVPDAVRVVAAVS